jgi:hypothetical protein
LQRIDIDLKEMIGLAEDNVNALKQLRTNIETEFEKMFIEVQVNTQYYLIFIPT